MNKRPIFFRLPFPYQDGSLLLLLRFNLPTDSKWFVSLSLIFSSGKKTRDFEYLWSCFVFSITVQLNVSNQKGLEKVKNHVSRTGIPSIITSPDESLRKGNWVKLICGASFEDAVDIRNLSLVYTLAGGKKVL